MIDEVDGSSSGGDLLDERLPATSNPASDIATTQVSVGLEKLTADPATRANRMGWATNVAVLQPIKTRGRTAAEASTTPGRIDHDEHEEVVGLGVSIGGGVDPHLARAVEKLAALIAAHG
ncbi:MAG: hypothetical protein GY698_15740 [Actinomycetia bacterium]|nr:hypothetical protein [Actinomycetes bacterium]